MSSLLEKLIEYSKEDYYPMHMPGHKRNTALLKEFDPYAIDITEIDGFDNLHHAEGVIKELLQRIERVYQSKRSYLLINGSTVGILAGIQACVNRGDTILMARNCHKAVYNAVILNELKPIYVYPQEDGIYGIHGGISPEKIEEMLITHPEIKLVVLTSPTYEGIVSDMDKIVAICHNYGAKVFVDEAHGAHLGFHPAFPKNSIQAGADVVIHSIHKTMPAFTQTAIMHVNQDIRLQQRVETYLGIYETSSPSYLLMAGVDQCISLLEEKSEELFWEYHRNLCEFYEEMQGLCHLQIMRGSDYIEEDIRNHGIAAVDASKILISVKNTTITGKTLANILLEKYKIQLEMSTLEYALAMTSICDTKEGFHRLRDALFEIDSKLCSKIEERQDKEFCENHFEATIKQKLSPYEAISAKTEDIGFLTSEGRVAAKHIMVYPPGIPIVAAGEIIVMEAITLVMNAIKEGLEVLGLEQNSDHGWDCCVVQNEESVGI